MSHLTFTSFVQIVENLVKNEESLLGASLQVYKLKNPNKDYWQGYIILIHALGEEIIITQKDFQEKYKIDVVKEEYSWHPLTEIKKRFRNTKIHSLSFTCKLYFKDFPVLKITTDLEEALKANTSNTFPRILYCKEG